MKAAILTELNQPLVVDDVTYTWHPDGDLDVGRVLVQME